MSERQLPFSKRRENLVWGLAEKARQFFPPAQRPVSSTDIVNSIGLSGPDGFPPEYVIEMMLQGLPEKGRLVDKPDTLQRVFEFGSSSAGGEREIVPGTEFPRFGRLFYFLLGLEEGLVVQPYETPQRSAPYPLLFRRDELPDLNRFFQEKGSHLTAMLEHYRAEATEIKEP